MGEKNMGAEKALVKFTKNKAFSKLWHFSFP
jgi:hypothetical protein